MSAVSATQRSASINDSTTQFRRLPTLWVPNIAVVAGDGRRCGRCWCRCVASCTGSSPRSPGLLCGRVVRRISRSSCFATSSQCSTAPRTVSRSPMSTGRCRQRSPKRCRDPNAKDGCDTGHAVALASTTRRPPLDPTDAYAWSTIDRTRAAAADHRDGNRQPDMGCGCRKCGRGGLSRPFASEPVGHCCVERSTGAAHRCGLVLRSDCFGEFIEGCRDT
jgi:hypothetical protein